MMSAFSNARIVSTTTWRTPQNPIASVRARSNIIARTTSGSTSGPIPAACERMSARCSSSRRSGGITVVASEPKPGGDPVHGIVAVGEALDDRSAAGDGLAGGRRQRHLCASAGNGHDIDGADAGCPEDDIARR